MSSIPTFMKLASCVAGIALLVLALFGQDVPVAEPHQVGKFYYLDPDTEGLIELEATAAKLITKQKGFGIGGSQTVYTMPGARSPVRLPEGKPGTFVYTVEPGTDPFRGIQFFRLDSKKDSRELLNTETVNGRTSAVMNRSMVPFRVARHGKMSFKVVMQEPLVPGEYGLSWTTSNVGYCFGVNHPDERK